MSEASEREKSRSYAGGAIHSQIGKDLTNDAGELEAVAGEAGREGDLSENPDAYRYEVLVRRHRVQAGLCLQKSPPPVEQAYRPSVRESCSRPSRGSLALLACS